jgi:hypothetical protein
MVADEESLPLHEEPEKPAVDEEPPSDKESDAGEDDEGEDDDDEDNDE